MFDFKDELSKICLCRENVDMKEVTTFKIGGRAKLVLYPNTVSQIKQCLDFCCKNKIKFIVLGACSNVLIKDEGIKDVVISTLYLDHFRVEDGNIICQAGKRLSQLVIFSSNLGLSGLEWAIGIPGSVGGAIFMNAGAFGGEIGNFVEWVEVWECGGIKKYKNLKKFFKYRFSPFTNGKNCVIISVCLKLIQMTSNYCKQIIKNYVIKRAETQKVGYPSAGSIFKANTPLAPAFMIEKCGLKGYSCGGAQVSRVHSGYIVNVGNATCADVLNLINHVKCKVFSSFGVDLELEIKIY